MKSLSLSGSPPFLSCWWHQSLYNHSCAVWLCPLATLKRNKDNFVTVLSLSLSSQNLCGKGGAYALNTALWQRGRLRIEHREMSSKNEDIIQYKSVNHWKMWSICFLRLQRSPENQRESQFIRTLFLPEPDEFHEKSQLIFHNSTISILWESHDNFSSSPKLTHKSSCENELGKRKMSATLKTWFNKKRTSFRKSSQCVVLQVTSFFYVLFNK